MEVIFKYIKMSSFLIKKVLETQNRHIFKDKLDLIVSLYKMLIFLSPVFHVMSNRLVSTF